MKKPWWRDENGPRNPFGPTGKNSFTAASVDVECIRVVEGRGGFPVDMLRYDHAFCMTPIPHPQQWLRRTYRVVVGFASRYKPTLARWESFGWKIITPPLTGEIPSALKQRVRGWHSFCHRCRVSTTAYAMSWFNADLICSRCEKKERDHPDFDLAMNTLRYAFTQGDYDYLGIGWPGSTREGSTPAGSA